MTLYPNAIDGTAQLPNVSGTMSLDGTAGGADHALVTTNINTAAIALEKTLGTTAGTSVLSAFVAGQTALPIQSGTLGTTIAKGTINNSIFGTPTLQSPIFTGAVTGGTFNNLIIGTPAITGGTANSITLGTPTLQGSVVNTANITANAITNGTGVSGTGLSQTITTVDSSTTPIAGGTITLTTTGGPVFINASVSAAKNNITGYIIAYLTIDGTQAMYNYSSPGQAATFNGIPITYFLPLAAGAHTFILGGAVQSGTMTVNAFGMNVIELKK